MKGTCSITRKKKKSTFAKLLDSYFLVHLWRLGKSFLFMFERQAKASSSVSTSSAMLSYDGKGWGLS